MYDIALLRFGTPYSLDGVNNSIYVLAEAFMELGCRVVLLGGYGVPTYRLTDAFDVDRIPEVYTLAKKSSFNRLRLWWLWIRRGAKLIEELAPDIIIANGVISTPNVGFRVLRVHDIPETLYQHLATKFFLKRYHCIVLSSSTLKAMFLERYKITEERVFVIPLPIKIRANPLDDREHAILFVNGRERRNLGFALKVFAEIAQRDRDVMMYVVGVENPPLGEYPRNRVHFLGLIDRSRLRSLYSRVKVLLIPSSYEGFGYPILEAFASGTPVIGSRALPEELLIDGYNGFRVKSYIPQTYAEKVLLLLGDERLWEDFSKNALMTAKQCASLNVAKRYIELYERFRESIMCTYGHSTEFRKGR